MKQILKQSCGFLVNEASDVIDHVLLAKRIKLRSLGVESHITTKWFFREPNMVPLWQWLATGGPRAKSARKERIYCFKSVFCGRSDGSTIFVRS